MAYFRYKNVRIAGLAAGVPKQVVDNNNSSYGSSNYESKDFVETTGVKERRYGKYPTSDLGFAAASRLMEDLRWDKTEVDALVFVSQNADYIEPATACILQDRLGFSKDCMAMDISLGCSGWVYGLNTVMSLLEGGSIKKAILIAGDAQRHTYEDNPLFGHAATATALEYQKGCTATYFNLGTDGSGFDTIIIPDGGSRNQFTEQSLASYEYDGKSLNRLQLRMNGMDVFSFGISVAPKSIKRLAEYYMFDYLDCDYLVLHQANMKMNQTIQKKLKFEDEKVPSSMYNFGNTSSASIPLTIVTQLKGKVENKKTRFLCCGFGVGLSWGTVAFVTDNIIISDLVEVDDTIIDTKYVV